MILLLLALAGVTLPEAIDFQRDVQPIFREHCVTCHGPTQQFGGLRLDRRADALRGGTQTDIGPGNADGSRLYHRLVGTAFGQQMPPTGPLTFEQTEIVRQWIDEGASWPDAASGEVSPPPADPEAIRLIQAIRDDDRAAVDAQLRGGKGVARSRGAGGSTPLMAAALYGDTALVKALLAAGADPNAANSAGVTSLMWAAPRVEIMQLLLDAGVVVRRGADHDIPDHVAAGSQRRQQRRVVPPSVCCWTTAPRPGPRARSIRRRCAKPRGSTMRKRSGCCSTTAPARRAPVRRRRT